MEKLEELTDANIVAESPAPLLRFPLSRCVPCILHLTLRVIEAILHRVVVATYLFEKKDTSCSSQSLGGGGNPMPLTSLYFRNVLHVDWFPTFEF